MSAAGGVAKSEADPPAAEDHKQFAQNIEQQIIDTICPESNIKEVEDFIHKIFVTETKAAEKAKAAQAKESPFIIKYKCPNCGNKDQERFAEDNSHGQVTCMRCGIVAQDHKIHDGEWKRQFEGDVNPSFHGPLPDPRFSSGHNLRTTISTGLPSAGDGQVKMRELKDLKYAQNYVEMNLSNMGSDVRRTREGYKDKMKQQAFKVMEDVASTLQLHEAVTHRAQLLFTNYRDMLQQVQKKEVVEAACVIASFREMLKAGGKPISSNNSKKRNSADMTGEKEANYEALHPFQCKHCGERFNQNKVLRLHRHQCKKRPKKG